MPAFQPHRGKPVVRNDGEGRGNVGIIRSPVRASTLPDCGGRSVMSVPTAISETSSQIIPLKARADSLNAAEFRPWRPLAFELQGREYAARGTSSAFSCVEIRAMPDESIAHENHHRARAQREEGLRARLRERAKTTGQTPFGLLGLANLDTRH